jgi:tRNA(fMet)-specific endonuclease VapC
VKYLLDTNAIIGILNGTPAQVRERLIHAQVAKHSILYSSISLHELWFGIGKSDRPRASEDNLRRLLIGRHEIVPFDALDAEISGNLRATLEKMGKPIGGYDLLIGAQAVRHDATLITANEKEFARVPGLKWENWAK